VKYLGGIDVGTTGVKCIVISDNGSLLSSCTENYPLYTPQPGWSEQVPEHWWAATQKAMHRAVETSGVDKMKISALGFSGQMHGLVALDRDDQVIRPAILWNDQRNEIECKEIISLAGGLDQLLEFTNNTMLTGYTGGKIFWLKKHEPENFNKMASFLMPKDFVRFKITSKKATDVSDASGTGLFDVKGRKWSTGLIHLLGFDASLFPKTYESDEIAGYVTKEAAASTGLMEGIPVYAGGGDAVIQTTGMGIVKEGSIGLIIGTSGVVSMSLDRFGRNASGALQFFCNNDKNKWQAFGCQLSSGGSMEWFKNALCPRDYSFETINAQVEKVKAGSNNLIFLPYLTGERSPYADSNARGVFFGLSLVHGMGDLARAVMEGVTFGLKDIYDLILMSNQDLDPKEVISSGGASKSAIWRQIQADIFNLPVKTLTGAAEGGAYGAAVVAGVGSGVWKSIEHASEFLSVEKINIPIKENVEVYGKLHRIYRKLYTDLKARFLDLRIIE